MPEAPTRQSVPSVPDRSVAGRYDARMRDGDVRAALHARLASSHGDDANTIVVDELGLCGTTRVDVAVVNGSLSGYELKSERDTLRRLPAQIETYSRVLDFATIVVADQHAPHVTGLLPPWWGITTASYTDSKVELVDLRRASPNPSVDPRSVATLLWRDEILDELLRRGLAVGIRSKPRSVLCDRLIESINVTELQQLVRDRLRSREGWRSASVQPGGGGRCLDGATLLDYLPRM